MTGDRSAGIGITFANSDLNLRFGDMGIFMLNSGGVSGQTSSFGAVEVIGMNIDGLNVVMRGNGL
ncbi:MAG: hypothetical protein IPM37_17005 [Hahellaceae bacterium]|nr:hypothetical protein [Hahellaceae bacterium]